MKRACKDCEWYAPLLRSPTVYSDTDGRCLCHVPDAEYGWPYVSVNDWCGEFQPRSKEMCAHICSVPGCIGCFFHGDGFDDCDLARRKLTGEFEIDVPGTRPVWCPLNQGAALVRLETKKEQE
ncbi:MAG: hypothetical protein WC565_07895 [Parcubacteria group bacterium]